MQEDEFTSKYIQIIVFLPSIFVMQYKNVHTIRVGIQVGTTCSFDPNAKYLQIK